MNNYWKFGLSISILAASFAAGRYLSPEKIKEVVKTVEVIKVEHETKTITIKPDGTKTIVIVKDTNTRTDSETNSREETKSKDRINVSVLVATQGFQFTNPIYGISVNKNILGPITAGVWALTNQTVGVSLGLNF